MLASQKRAVETHRRRLGERGLARYEVRGLERDKELIRSLARQVAKPPLTGKEIWDALRRSPAVGADLDLSREIVPERETGL